MKIFVSLIFFMMILSTIFPEARAEEMRIGKKTVLDIEIARTESERAKGLMCRTGLAENAGMLFLFPDLRKPSFWMKDTVIPLDMVFIAPDATIQEIYAKAKPLDLTPITPEKPVRAVLEIGGGMAEKLGLKVGDLVSSETLAKSLELP